MRKIIIVFIVIFSLGAIFVYHYSKFNDRKLHVVFCDVGQGDAIFLRTPKGSDILIDGGPNNSVLSCLLGHMPFWDRDLELVILSHPHADHLNGLIEVAKRYKIKSFATENLKNNTASFRVLIDEIKKQNIKIQYLHTGDRFSFKDGLILEIVGPSREFIGETSPTGMIGESSEFANILTLFNYKDFSLFLTGDSQKEGIKDAILSGFLQDIDVLQVPHHGSKTGLDSEILSYLKPELAVISVGKNNKYSHPAKEIIEILRNQEIKTLRMDQNGEIEIMTDGINWIVE
ncbi:MAG: hypothetical protein ACD_50C00338G0004 [uncultured bacterium]|nr:MAG: hypothetical protein ACD_50C00338G0004 [uncultured bacterium]OGH13471.1 MAG: hypothetical protein A2687_02180 [Candidatus Levybacteria bacterium RIFCSPHIGHO2_01_FULL_38_26]